MSEDGHQRVYPSMPLEVKIDPTQQQQQQPLIAPPADSTRPPKPPSYEQAIGETTPALTEGPHVVVVTGKWKIKIKYVPNCAIKQIFVFTLEPVTAYGPSPVDVQCPYCHNYCRTRVRSSPTSRTHLIALLLCLFQ